jgi:calcineurin-like phosphoesterase family protein
VEEDCGVFEMIWLTSDLHIWHANIIKFCNRPYKSIEEMNEALVNNWNKVVSPEDSVYCLGDFSMAAHPVETFTPRLMGKKYIVPGNHDHLHSYHKKSRNPDNQKKWIKFYEDNGWIVLPEQTTLELEGIGTVNLCHHPYGDENSGDPAGYEDKYAKWRPIDDGKILLCGHIHEKWLTKRSSKGTLMVNVGVDVHNMAPISELEIVELIKANLNK